MCEVEVMARQSREISVPLLLTQQHFKLFQASQTSVSIPFTIDSLDPQTVFWDSIRDDLSWQIAGGGGLLMTPQNIVMFGGAFVSFMPFDDSAGSLIMPTVPRSTGSHGHTIYLPVLPPGSYSLNITANPPPAEVTPVSVLVMSTGGAAISVFPSESRVAANRSVVISVAVYHGINPITGASVALTIVRPDSTSVVVMATDDGLGSDGRAKDGLYVATLGDNGSLLASGEYIVLAEVEGTNQAGHAFKRDSATGFEVVAACGQFSNLIFTDAAFDDNGDNRMDGIRFTTPIQTPSEAEYEMKLKIIVPWWPKPLWADGRVSRGPNGPSSMQATAELEMSAEQLEAMRPGRLKIQEATLVLHAGGLRLSCDSHFGLELWSSVTYNNSPFGGWGMAWTMPRNDEGIDSIIDDGGEYDILRVRYGIKVRETGEYRIEATLTAACRPDAFEHEDSWRLTDIETIKFKRSLIAAGPNQFVMMDFDGSKIGLKGFSGPYRVTDVAIYGPYTELLNYKGPQHVTRYYDARQFENYQAPFDYDRNGIADICEIRDGSAPDTNGSGIIDEFEGGRCPLDTDGDGEINQEDLSNFTNSWTAASERGTGGYSCPGDYNGDGVVDQEDLILFLTMWFGYTDPGTGGGNPGVGRKAIQRP